MRECREYPIQASVSFVLVVSAGSPSMSSPDQVRSLPRWSALAFPLTPFTLEDFVPVKSGRRRAELERAVSRPETSVYFESPHRLLKTLQVLAEVAPEADVCVARELTKKFEEYRRGSPAELCVHYESRPPKGEITLVISSLSRASGNEHDASCGSC